MRSRLHKLLPLAVLFACSQDDKPDAFVKAGVRAASGEPQALWTALPASYQKDVQALILDFAGRMNEPLWNDSFVLAQKVVRVVETKKSFVLGHPALSGLLAPDALAQGADPAVRVVSRLVNSDLRTLEGLKKLEVERFLAGPVADSMKDLEKSVDVAASSAPDKKAKEIRGFLPKMQSAKVTIDSSEGDNAKVTILIEGEKPETIEMVRVEGKWIPKDLADAWPKAMAEARAGLVEIKIEPAMLVQFAGVKGMLEAVLDGLMKADSQEAFNTEVGSLMEGLGKKPRTEIARADSLSSDSIGKSQQNRAKIRRSKPRRSRR